MINLSNTNGALGCRRIHHSTLLRDLRFAPGDQTSRCSPGGLHQVAPVVVTDESGCFTRANRRSRFSLIEQSNNRLLQRYVLRSDLALAAGIRAILDVIPVLRSQALRQVITRPQEEQSLVSPAAPAIRD